LKRRYPRLKIFISLEGRASDFAQDAQPENRDAFVRSCVDLYLRGQFAPGVTHPGLFDGVDIDWESPHREDAANFQALIEEFRRQMKAVRPGLRLAVALEKSPHTLPGTDFKALVPLVDEFGIMNYDYAGPWEHTTGFLAPLFSSSGDHGHSGSVQSSIDQFLAAGVPAGKMLMGLPFYGYGWREVDDRDNGLHQPGKAVRGDRPYSFIRAQGQPSQTYRDSRSQAPWIFDGQTFWTYEDPVSIRFKASYASRRRLAGVMIWELSGDTTDGVLLDSAWRSLHHPLRSRTFARALATPPKHSAAVAQR
jgi:chitinase